MSILKSRILIAALSLVLFTSVAVLCIHPAATSVDADTGYPAVDDLCSDLELLGPDDPYEPDETITLPALPAGETITIDGMREGTPTTISNVIPSISPVPLFVIEAGNEGTYIFTNFIIEGYAMEIEAGAGSDSVVFDNVVFAGDTEQKILSNCSDLVVRSCIIQCGYGPDIIVESGKFTIEDSVVFGSYGSPFAYTETGGKISIDNCYIYGSSVQAMCAGTIGTELSIKDSTFVGASHMCSVKVTLPEMSGDVTIDILISGSLFTSMDGIGGPAFSISGSATGSIVIEQCQFSGLGDNYYPAYMPIVNLDIYSAPISFLISDTTFYSNCTGDYGAPSPMLYIRGMTGEVVNSTFWNNTAIDRGSSDADDIIGCVVIEDAQVEFINNTFLDNYYLYYDGEDVLVPASLRVSYSEMDLVNNIFVCQYGDDDGYTSTILDEDLCIPTLDWNIDGVGSEIYEKIFPYFMGDEGNDGLYAGFSLLDRYSESPTEVIIVPEEIDTATGTVIYTVTMLDHPEEIITVPILPFGDADGWGTEGAPEKDQRGKPRSEYPDMGSVSIDTALFFANGGYWDIYLYEGYMVGDQYRYMVDEETGDFDKAAVLADEDGSILLPVDYQYLLLMHPELRFLGWSTDLDADMPDYMFVNDISGTMRGEFAVDMFYYAVWGEDFIIVFEPENGTLAPVMKVVVPDETIESPTYGIVNGMKLVGWVDGDGYDWDPDNTHLDGNMTVYGVWETIASPAKVPVEFRNGDVSDTVLVTAGSSVSKPADPERAGYEFKGWFTAEEGGTQWDFDTPVTTGMVLYAQWEEVVMFEVTFDPCNGAATFIIEVRSGQRMSSPLAPVWEDHAFGGWFTAADGGNRWNFNTAVTGNMYLYGQWNVTRSDNDDDDGWFNEKEGTIIAAVVFASFVASLGIIPLGGSAGILSQVSVAHVFQQGMSDADRGDNSKEEKNRRSVIFDPKNGRPVWTSSVINGRMVSQPSDPKPPKGKRFSHWSETPGGPPFSFMTPITKVTHLYAVYI